MTEIAWQWVESLGHWLLAWTVVVVVICTWLLVTRVRRAGVRYAGWLVATFAGVAFLPVVVSVSPVVSVPQAVGYVGGSAALTAERLDELSTWLGRNRGVPRIAATATGLPGEADQQAGTDRISFVGPMFAAWMVGLVFYLLRLTWAAVRVRRLIAASNLPVPTNLRALFDATRRELEIGRNIRLVVHSETQTPLCTGIVRPTVVWPAAANDTMCPRERRAAMIHELAHLKRYDDWLRLAGELWRGLCWFYVPVHWTLARLRREQEYLCDNLAARTLDRPETYAQLLLDHTRVRVPSPILCSSFDGGSAMTSRVRRILRDEQRLTPLSRKQATIGVALSILLLVGAGSLRLVGLVTHATAAEAAAKQTVRGNDQGSEGENAAVAALKRFGAEIERNAKGEVVGVSIGSKFSPSEFGDRDIVHLEKLRWNNTHAYLDVRQANITNSGVAKIAQIADFDYLGFYGSRLITDEGLVHLEPLSKLRVLWLDETGITNDAIKTFKNLKSLRRLGLIGTKITDDGLAKLSELRSLEMLNLSYTKVTDIGVEHLSKLTNLERLFLTGTDITNTGLAHLKTLKKLQSLSLGECPHITNDGLVHLRGLNELTTLGLSRTKITDAGLVHLRGLVNLWGLTLNETTVSDAGLVHIKDLRNLVRLSISGTKITNDGLIHVRGLPSLEVLGLNDTKVSDSGLEHLTGLKSLKFLNLQGSQVGDAGLEHVKKLSSLQTLDVRDTSVTEAGVQSLLRALPNCDVGDWFSWRRSVTGVKQNPVPSYLSPGPDLSRRNKKKTNESE